MKTKIMIFLCSLLPMMWALSCNSTSACLPEPDNQVSPETSSRVEEPVFTLCKGGDISWLTRMEQEGWKFYDDAGKQEDCLVILKGKGFNAVRLRVWVDPTDGWDSTADVIDKAKRAKALGMDIMIDFHYSDSWADPGQQTVPTAWKGQNIDQLVETLAEYTENTLNQLKDADIEPLWVQVGNETGNGLLWPYGKADTNPEGYARLINAGYGAVKNVFPDTKVIVHIHNGQDNGLYRWNLDILKKYGTRYDIIGMSLYPEKNNWCEFVDKCHANMLDCIQRYDKDVMLCEVGMGNAYVEECRSFLTACFQLSEEIEGNRYLGLLYWEPQVYNGFQGYHKGAFTSQGRPSAALDAYSYGSTGIHEITAE